MRKSWELWQSRGSLSTANHCSQTHLRWKLFGNLSANDNCNPDAAHGRKGRPGARVGWFWHKKLRTNAQWLLLADWPLESESLLRRTIANSVQNLPELVICAGAAKNIRQNSWFLTGAIRWEKQPIYRWLISAGKTSLHNGASQRIAGSGSTVHQNWAWPPSERREKGLESGHDAPAEGVDPLQTDEGRPARKRGPQIVSKSSINTCANCDWRQQRANVTNQGARGTSSSDDSVSIDDRSSPRHWPA